MVPSMKPTSLAPRIAGSTCAYQRTKLPLASFSVMLTPPKGDPWFGWLEEEDDIGDWRLDLDVFGGWL